MVRSNQLVTGPHLDSLSQKLRRRYQKKYCLLTSNASSALLLAMLAMKIKRQNVLMPAVSTCFSFVNATLASGNIPVFCDIEPDSGNIDINAAKKIFTKRKIGLIISPNHFGIPSPINELKKFGVPVIEDAAQSALTNLDKRSKADVVVLSFYPTKIINGVDGGALLTDDFELFKRADDQVYYQHQYSFDGKIRFNLRMHNLHAFLALKSFSGAQKTREDLDKIRLEFVRHATQLGLSFLGMKQTFIPFRFLIKLKNKKQTQTLVNYCKTKRIEATGELIFIANKGEYPVAVELMDTTIALPFHTALTPHHIRYLFQTVKDGIGN